MIKKKRYVFIAQVLAKASLHRIPMMQFEESPLCNDVIYDLFIDHDVSLLYLCIGQEPSVPSQRVFALSTLASEGKNMHIVPALKVRNCTQGVNSISYVKWDIDT